MLMKADVASQRVHRRAARYAAASTGHAHERLRDTLSWLNTSVNHVVQSASAAQALDKMQYYSMYAVIRSCVRGTRQTSSCCEEGRVMSSNSTDLQFASTAIAMIEHAVMQLGLSELSW